MEESEVESAEAEEEELLAHTSGKASSGASLWKAGSQQANDVPSVTLSLFSSFSVVDSFTSPATGFPVRSKRCGHSGDPSPVTPREPPSACFSTSGDGVGFTRTPVPTHRVISVAGGMRNTNQEPHPGDLVVIDEGAVSQRK